MSFFCHVCDEHVKTRSKNEAKKETLEKYCNFSFPRKRELHSSLYMRKKRSKNLFRRGVHSIKEHSLRLTRYNVIKFNYADRYALSRDSNDIMFSMSEYEKYLIGNGIVWCIKERWNCTHKERDERDRFHGLMSSAFSTLDERSF